MPVLAYCCICVPVFIAQVAVLSPSRGGTGAGQLCEASAGQRTVVTTLWWSVCISKALFARIFRKLYVRTE